MKKTGFTALALVTALALCLCLTACNDKTGNRLQNAAGVVLEGGGFEEGAVLNANEVDNTSETANEVFEKLGKIGITITDKAKAFIYDIFVSRDGQEVQPNGKVKVTLPMPRNDTETAYTVYHLEDSGKAVKLPATCADGKLTFETDGFSYYVIVATDSILTNTVDEKSECELTATAGTGGSITDGYANGKKMEQGTSVTLTATADNGYRFVGWFTGDTKVSEDMSYSFTVNEDTALVAQFEKDAPVAPVTPIAPIECTVTATAGAGGRVTDGYANGKKVEQGTSVTLTATADNGYRFVGWFAGNTKVSENAGYSFTVNEDTTLVAQFEKDASVVPVAPVAPIECTVTATAGAGGRVTDGYANGKKVEQGTSVTLTATADNGYRFVGWFAGNTKVSENASYAFTVNEDTTLVAQFAERPSDGALTETEWNAAIAYWKAQTNIRVYERTVTSQTYDPQYGGMGADIRIYQLAGTAYSEDGYFEDDELSQQYKGKLTYLVKLGDKYYSFSWYDGEWNDELREYVGGYWIKEDYFAKDRYDSALDSNIYAFRDAHGGKIDFSYTGFTYDSATKSYKNSDGSVTVAFTYSNQVLTKIVVTEVYEDDTDYSMTTMSTLTFGDAVVEVPANAKCSFSTGVKTEDAWNSNAGYITENGGTVKYWYDYLDDGTVLTLTAVAKDDYRFKRWAKEKFVNGEYVWVTYSTEPTYTVTVDGEYGALYAVFEKQESDA